MNRYESIILDKMVDRGNALRESLVADIDNKERERLIHDILMLLDCICEFREPPRALDVADGYGAMVDERGEVVA